MNMHRGHRIAVGLSVVGIGALIALGGGTAAHAQSGSPLLSAYRTVSGSAEQVVLSGTGFSPGGSVTIEILDQRSGVVLATTSLQATASTAQWGYGADPQPACWPLVVSPLQGAIGGSSLAPRGSVNKVAGGYQNFCKEPPCASFAVRSAPMVAGGAWISQLPRGAGGKPGLPQCMAEAVSVPQTTYVGGGDIAGTVEVASTDSVVVEAIDTSTSAEISQVAL
jgi:hypothetical protein